MSGSSGDLRLQSAHWLREFERRGGRLHLETASPARIDDIARASDLTIVATGKEGGALFERDPVRSPADAPLRHLAMVNCEGPAILSEHLARLERGEEDVVVIGRRNQPIVELRAIPQPRTTRRPILRRDPRFQMPKSFFEPLPDSLLAEFEGGA